MLAGFVDDFLVEVVQLDVGDEIGFALACLGCFVSLVAGLVGFVEAFACEFPGQSCCFLDVAHAPTVRLIFPKVHHPATWWESLPKVARLTARL